jgi:type III pantothenate kinase
VLLAIDVGNTQTVIGVYDGPEMIRHWRVQTEPGRTADEYGVLLWNLYRASRLQTPDIQGIVVSCVVPSMVSVVEELCATFFQRPPIVVGPGVKTGMPILYDNPKEVGADRIVNAVAAYERFHDVAIVVDFGTATTFDVVADDGAFLGGAIAPGVETAAASLFSRTALLPRIAFGFPDTAIGRTTVENLQIGLYHGTALLVDGLVDRIRSEWEPGARVVATGGLATRFAERCARVDVVDPDLTLKGIGWGHDRLHPATA